MPKVAVVIFSQYGHTKALADAVVESLQAEGVDTTLLRVPSEKDSTGLPEAQVADLPNYDGFLFGIPTRYGTPGADVKTFWDATGGLWSEQKLGGKYAGVFTSTGTQHGGQETTIFTFIPHLVHHGMLFVPLGYASEHLFDNTEIVGGGPWGAGTIAGGDGSREVSEKEKAIAKVQAKAFADVLKRIKVDAVPVAKAETTAAAAAAVEAEEKPAEVATAAAKSVAKKSVDAAEPPTLQRSQSKVGKFFSKLVQKFK
ncbi:flavoprotein-like protein [Cladochytrium replicatum]|nr:flavoprotein-like protein [Cladochytrium replicatum]